MSQWPFSKNIGSHFRNNQMDQCLCLAWKWSRCHSQWCSTVRLSICWGICITDYLEPPVQAAMPFKFTCYMKSDWQSCCGWLSMTALLHWRLDSENSTQGGTSKIVWCKRCILWSDHTSSFKYQVGVNACWSGINKSNRITKRSFSNKTTSECSTNKFGFLSLYTVW